MDWTKEEVRVILKDYFNMLILDINRDRYNKTEHRRNLLKVLKNRSNGSIEFKHQNISAALINMGLPFIKGYAPRFNYQKELLEKEISDLISANRPMFENEFEKFSTGQAVDLKVGKIDFSKMLNNDPANSEVNEDEPLYRPVKINHLEKEQNNRRLGEAGEELIIKYEKWRLIQAGKDGFADKIEWISKEQGDGAGFDILSKNINGTDRFIEVKTTKLSKETPIYLTKTELSFAEKKENEFYLYRLFNFESLPQFFIRNGSYDNFCHLRAESFKGFFR